MFNNENKTNPIDLNDAAFLQPGDPVFFATVFRAVVIAQETTVRGLDRGQDTYRIKLLYRENREVTTVRRSAMQFTCAAYKKTVVLRSTLGMRADCEGCEFQLSCLARR